MLRSVNHLPRFIARSNVIIRNIDFFLRWINLIFTFPLFFPAISFANPAFEAGKWSVFSRKLQSRSGKSEMWYRHECKEFLIQISHFHSIILSNLRYLWIIHILISRIFFLQNYPVIDHCYDVVVVGAGGAGLRAAFGLGNFITNHSYVISKLNRDNFFFFFSHFSFPFQFQR